MRHHPSHLTHFQGLPVRHFAGGGPGTGPDLSVPASVARRPTADREVPFEERRSAFPDRVREVLGPYAPDPALTPVPRSPHDPEARHVAVGE